MCRLDWTNAFAGRISRKDLETYQARLESLSSRLHAEIQAGRLPFVDMPYWPKLRGELQALEPTFRTYEHMLLLGIGGSALGPRALQKAFYPGQDQPGHQGRWLWILDNVDASTLQAHLDRLPAESTMVVVVSKSGGTIETIGQYLIVKEWLKQARGDVWSEQVIAVTDPAKGFLREEAEANKIHAFDVPENLGGRYSVLSAVGLIPALFLGIDCQSLMAGALEATKALTAPIPEALGSHPAWRLAAWAKGLMDKGYSQLIFFTYIPSWATFGDWFCQLWAESLGKEGKGSMPLAAVGVTDQHSLQQMFLGGPRAKGCLLLHGPREQGGPRFASKLPEKWSFLAGRPFADLLEAETLGTRMALNRSETPLVSLEFGETGPAQAGWMMALMELATLLTGWLLDINPLDQPQVELGKRLANARLGAKGYAEEEAMLRDFLEQPKDIQEF